MRQDAAFEEGVELVLDELRQPVFKDLAEPDPATFGDPRLPMRPFTLEQTREIVFKAMLDGEQHHSIQLDGGGPADYRSVVAFFARQLLKCATCPNHCKAGINALTVRMSGATHIEDRIHQRAALRLRLCRSSRLRAAQAAERRGAGDELPRIPGNALTHSAKP